MRSFVHPERRNSFLLLAILVMMQGCGLSRHNDYDQKRCHPACGSDRVCFQGWCVRLDAAPQAPKDAGADVDQDKGPMDAAIAVDTPPLPDWTPDEALPPDSRPPDLKPPPDQLFKDSPLKPDTTLPPDLLPPDTALPPDLLPPDTTAPTCGDNSINVAGEVCDGSALGGQTCKTQGFYAGSLDCNSDCLSFDTSACHDCGNGTLDLGESCDTSQLNNESCESLDFDGGLLLCNLDCTYNTSACYACGDLERNGSEACDGQDFGAETCKNYGFYAGELQCNGDCTIDITGCHDCGNGLLDPGEICDMANMDGHSCVGMGFGGGVLQCSDSCTLDPRYCYTQGWITLQADTYTRGSPSTEPCRFPSEEQHQVTLTRPFEISPLEVTQAQFQALMGYNPSIHLACGSSCPVENVSWNEAAAYCNALSLQRDIDTCYSCAGSGAGVTCDEAPEYSEAKIYQCPGYRLPTDGEWEYACRAGTSSAFYNGPINSCFGSDSTAAAIGWYQDNSNNTTNPAGQKLANAWGLHDMSGNVCEWIHDWHEKHPISGTVTDPWTSPYPDHLYRGIRGGSLMSNPADLRSAYRNRVGVQDYRDRALGFRCVRQRK